MAETIYSISIAFCTYCSPKMLQALFSFCKNWNYRSATSIFILTIWLYKVGREHNTCCISDLQNPLVCSTLQTYLRVKLFQMPGSLVQHVVYSLLSRGLWIDKGTFNLIFWVLREVNDDHIFKLLSFHLVFSILTFVRSDVITRSCFWKLISIL